MSLITIVLVLIVVGVLLWLINTYVPMQTTIKSILNAVVVIVLVIWLLQSFGVLGELGRVRIGQTGMHRQGYAMVVDLGHPSNF